MSTHSLDGRSWAKYSALRPGDLLVADGGFTCLLDGQVCKVEADGEGELFVYCSGSDEGSGSDDNPKPSQHAHYLVGQLSDEDEDSLVGFWPAGTEVGI